MEKAVLRIGIGMVYSAYVGDDVDLAKRSLRRTTPEPLRAATARFGLSAQVEAPTQMTCQQHRESDQVYASLLYFYLNHCEYLQLLMCPVCSTSDLFMN